MFYGADGAPVAIAVARWFDARCRGSPGVALGAAPFDGSEGIDVTLGKTFTTFAPGKLYQFGEGAGLVSCTYWAPGPAQYVSWYCHPGVACSALPLERSMEVVVLRRHTPASAFICERLHLFDCSGSAARTNRTPLSALQIFRAQHPFMAGSTAKKHGGVIVDVGGCETFATTVACKTANVIELKRLEERMTGRGLARTDGAPRAMSSLGSFDFVSGGPPVVTSLALPMQRNGVVLIGLG